MLTSRPFRPFHRPCAAAALSAVIGLGAPPLAAQPSPVLSDFVHLIGSPGADVLRAGDKPTWIEGGAGDDLLFGGPATGFLNGNTGNDTLRGGPGDETLHGGAGDDRLFGGPGADRLSGDRGDDTLTGGAGADRFLFGTGAGHDVVTDFSSAEGDRVVIRADEHFSLRDTPQGVSLLMSSGDRMLLAGLTIGRLGQWLELAPVPAGVSITPVAPVANTPSTPELRDRSGAVLEITAVVFILTWIGWGVSRRRRRRDPPASPPTSVSAQGGGEG